MADDRLAAELAAIQGRVVYVAASARIGVGANQHARNSAADVPRLLAAVEAVLEITDPLKNESLGGTFMAALHLQVLAAITSALLGEENPGG
jgi:hypothetical protein